VRWRQEISRKKPVLKNRVLQETEDAIVASVSTRRGPEILTRLLAFRAMTRACSLLRFHAIKNEKTSTRPVGRCPTAV